MRSLGAALSACVFLAGCDPPNSSPSPTPGAETAATPDRPIPLLPDAPWFVLPDDWAEQHPVVSPNAQYEAHYQSLAEGQLVLNPADGDGRAWLESVTAIDSDDDSRATWHRNEDDRPRPVVVASSLQRIAVGFEVGTRGIAEGGRLFVMPEPFWSWSEAQVEDPDAFGFTTAKAPRANIELVPEGPGASFRVEGGALAPGERIDIVVGAGRRGTRVDEFAEHGSEILLALDGDGDGTRRWLPESLQLDVVARQGVRIVAFGPADVAPGDAIEVSIAVLDALGNRARWPGDLDSVAGREANRFNLERTNGDAIVSQAPVISATPEQDAYRIRLSVPEEPGTLRLAVRGHGAFEGFEATVNPIVVRNSSRRLVWADLHGHSRFSDGTGSPDDYFSYARDIARLDVAALTDHDHWGVRPLDKNPDLAAKILQSAQAFHEPGRFVTIPGYEWTNWLHGHRHVLYFDDQAPILSAIDPATDRPDELWQALRGQPALTFAHHSAGDPVATNWFYAPDPEIEPLTEISSIHGMSEAADSPRPVHGGIPGNFVRDVLLHGIQLGFIGSGDSHDGHPGLVHLVSGQGGLAGIFTESLDRASLLVAMQRKQTFASNGIRPWLEVFIDETFMGGSLPAQTKDSILRVRFEATGAIDHIDLVRSGRIATIDAEGALSIDFERSIPRLNPGEFHYVRIVQQDGGVAWSSPIFVDGPSPSGD